MKYLRVLTRLSRPLPYLQHSTHIMHNLVAYYASLANGSALANLTPVADPLVTVSANNRFIFPDDYYIGAAMGLIPNGTRWRLNTPSMRTIALPELFPFNNGTSPTSNPPMVGPIWGDLRIPRNDECGMDISRGGAAAADTFVGLWLAPRMVPAPEGPTLTMRATGSVTLTDGTWVLFTLTFDQTLPYGKYAVVGMHVFCASGIFARLTFPGQTQFRPGVPVTQNQTDYVNPQMFRYGNFGLFGVFDSTAQPSMEMLGQAAGAQSPVILLDLIKVA